MNRNIDIIELGLSYSHFTGIYIGIVQNQSTHSIQIYYSLFTEIPIQCTQWKWQCTRGYTKLILWILCYPFISNVWLWYRIIHIENTQYEQRFSHNKTQKWPLTNVFDSILLEKWAMSSQCKHENQMDK